MAHIIQFPGGNPAGKGRGEGSNPPHKDPQDRPGSDRQQQFSSSFASPLAPDSGSSQKKSQSKEGKVLSFGSRALTARIPETQEWIELAGLEMSRILGGDAPDWARAVHCSSWWRLGAVLVDELAQGDLKFDSGHALPSRVMQRLSMAFGPDLGKTLRLSMEEELAQVIWMLESRDILVHTRSRMSLHDAAQGMETQLWVIWAEFFDFCQNFSQWISPHHKKLGDAMQTLIPKSLGLIRASTEAGALPEGQLMELATLNLDFDTTLNDLGIKLPPSELAFHKPGRPSIPEQEWFRLLVRAFAVPMGLADYHADHTLSSTELLAIL